MLCRHAWTDLFCMVFELPQMESRQGRETGDQSAYGQGCQGQSTNQRRGIRVDVVLDS